MRVESSVTTISWIPSEAVTDGVQGALQCWHGHYDDPPPRRVDDVDAFASAGGCRFANQLSAWIEVEDGRIAGNGQTGHGLSGRRPCAWAAGDDFRGSGFAQPSRI